MSVQLSNHERERVIEDIVTHKYEEVRGFREADLESLESRLHDKSDAELVKHWRETVGEWICSRADSMQAFEESSHTDIDSFLDEQLELTITGQKTDRAYGFL